MSEAPPDSTGSSPLVDELFSATCAEVRRLVRWRLRGGDAWPRR